MPYIVRWKMMICAHSAKGFHDCHKMALWLIWNPGYAEVDFEEADFYEDTHFGSVRRKYLVVSFPYSNDSYDHLFGVETTEYVCHWLQDIFAYLIFDNATGVRHRVNDKVTETKFFQRFRAHYRFQVNFCNPESDWEKDNVENKVGTVCKNLFVLAPHYHDIVSYNQEPLKEHTKKASELHYKKQMQISELFQEDKRHSSIFHLRFSISTGMSGLRLTVIKKSVLMENTTILHPSRESWSRGACRNQDSLY